MNGKYCGRMNWHKLLLCAVLCFSWIAYPLSSVHAQEETPPPTAEVTAQENPPAESTPDAVIVVVSADGTEDSSAAQTAPETVTSLLVQYDAGASQDELVQSLAKYGAVVQNNLNKINFIVLNVPQSNYDAAMSGLSSTQGVLLVEKNQEVQLEDTIPNDSGYSQQYGLDAIHAPQGWDYGTGSSHVTIAIVDSGVDLTHPDLASKIVGGYDFVNNDAEAMDDNGHGTHVAGIAAAVTDNGDGVAGVSWGAQIMPVKVLNSGGNGTYDNVAQGIIYAVDNGAQVVNLSLGSTKDPVDPAHPNGVMQSAIQYAYSHGVVVVAASGNNGASVMYPAAYSSVIAVAASDQSNNPTVFSSHGPQVDVAAPGVNIYSTALGGGYEYRSGTSMATAYVTGEVALLLSVNSDLSPDEVSEIVTSTAVDIGASGVDDYTGSGLIQLDAAMESVPPTEEIVEPPTEEEDTSSNRNEDVSVRPKSPLPGQTSGGPPLPTATPASSIAAATEETTAEVSAQVVTPVAQSLMASNENMTSASPIVCTGVGLALTAILFLLFFVLRRKRSTE